MIRFTEANTLLTGERHIGPPHTEMMRRDWDARARKNAMHYIASWEGQWGTEAFFASGHEDYQRFVAPALERMSLDPVGKAMLEIGAGVGRMTREFARHFGQVIALDISAEMLARGREFHPQHTNIDWVLGDGAGLGEIPDGAVDFVFSYIVLHHMPAKELSLGYIREMLRVLRPGGVFQFHFHSQKTSSMNWKGRLAWGLIDRLHEPVLGMRLEKWSHRLARGLGLDQDAAGRTWRGAVLDVREVLETAWAAGGAVREVTGWSTPHTWCLGAKL